MVKKSGASPSRTTKCSSTQINVQTVSYLKLTCHVHCSNMKYQQPSTRSTQTVKHEVQATCYVRSTRRILLLLQTALGNRHTPTVDCVVVFRDGMHKNCRWLGLPEPLKRSETHPDIGQFRAQHRHVCTLLC